MLITLLKTEKAPSETEPFRLEANLNFGPLGCHCRWGKSNCFGSLSVSDCAKGKRLS